MKLFLAAAKDSREARAARTASRRLPAARTLLAGLAAAVSVSGLIAPVAHAAPRAVMRGW